MCAGEHITDMRHALSHPHWRNDITTHLHVLQEKVRAVLNSNSCWHSHLTAGAALPSRTFFCKALFKRDGLPLKMPGAVCVICARSASDPGATLVCSCTVTFDLLDPVPVAVGLCTAELKICVAIDQTDLVYVAVPRAL